MPANGSAGPHAGGTAIAECYNRVPGEHVDTEPFPIAPARISSTESANLVTNGQSPDTASKASGPIYHSLARNLTAGTLCALTMVAYAGSCTSLIFSGRLAVYSEQGMLAALVSSIVTVLVLSCFSSFRLSLGGLIPTLPRFSRSRQRPSPPRSSRNRAATTALSCRRCSRSSPFRPSAAA